MANNQKIVFITGGNTGIGFEVVKALAASGNIYQIIVGCRTVSKGEDAIEDIKKELPNTASSLSTVQADLTSDASLEQAIQTIGTKFGRIDFLINNAGASFDNLQTQGKLSIREAWNASWDTNVAGTQVLTTLAVPLLLKSADPRLVFLTSGTSSLSETERLDGPTYQRLNGSPDKGWPKVANGPEVISYRSSKTGLNMLMRHWHRLLKNDGVKVWAVSPGFLATGLAGVGAEYLRKLGAQDPARGGKLIRTVLEGGRDEDAGKVVRADDIQAW